MSQQDAYLNLSDDEFYRLSSLIGSKIPGLVSIDFIHVRALNQKPHTSVSEATIEYDLHPGPPGSKRQAVDYPPTLSEVAPMEMAQNRGHFLAMMLGQTLAYIETSMEAGGIIGDLKQEVPGLRAWWDANKQRYVE